VRTAGESNNEYENWLRESANVVDDDLKYKHKKMRKDAVGFAYLRGTFYRWAETYPDCCPQLQDAPVVLAWGDAHVQNFGTWRDEQGRLVWGINDFDDATPVPYTNDLVRLVTSALLAAPDVEREGIAQWVLDGYREGLEQGGQPFVLQEKHKVLRTLAIDRIGDPDSFWEEEQGEKSRREEEGEEKEKKKPKTTEITDPTKIPFVVSTELLGQLPSGVTDVHVYARKAGIGSLGRPRYSVIAEWRGGKVAREIKQLVPSAWVWARSNDAADKRVGQPHYRRLLNTAVRCPDPFAHVTADDAWVVRRLAPDCVRIELKEKNEKLELNRSERQELLTAMGKEVANIHLGSPGAAAALLRDLDNRGDDGGDWLMSAANTMRLQTQNDYGQWRTDRV
jgi:uncharacterized protein (DUF2252 family)